MIPPLDVFAISKDEPVWLGAAETLVQALEIAQATGTGSYLVFWHQTGHKAMYMVDATGAILFELKYRDCPHTSMIPLGHGADCKVHCFICQPWKREQPGKCPACQAKELAGAKAGRDAVADLEFVVVWLLWGWHAGNVPLACH